MQLGIPADKHTIIYSGSLEKWTGLQILLDDFEKKWDKRFWLVLHSRFVLSKGDHFYDRIEELIAKGLNISFHKVPFESMSDLEEYVSQFDFGMVTYLPQGTPYTGKNITEIGLASGKFSMYMKMGLPVVASSGAMYKNLMSTYDFGVLAENMNEIPPRLGELLNDTSHKITSCKKLYDEHLFPSNKMNELINYLVEDKTSK